MNKKGFTLVELLAVIAILAILVIIALPNVLKMYNNAKKNSFLTEAKTLAQDVSSKYITESMKGNKLTTISNKQNSLDLSGRNIEYEFKLDSNGKIKSMMVYDGTYCVSTTKDYTGLKTTDVSESCSYDELHNIAGTLSKDFYEKSGKTDRSLVNSITFYSDGRTISGAESYDVSEKGDNSIIMYVKPISDSSTLLDLTIVANGKIAFPENSSELFGFYKPTDYTGKYFVYNLKSLNFNHSIDTSKVTDMSGMFIYAQAPSLDLSDFDTSNVTGMGNMFLRSNVGEINLTSFDTSKVTDMIGMFNNSNASILNLSSFNTSNVTNMGYMFCASAATEIKGLENFNTEKVTDMSGMFNNSKATTLNLTSFDTSNVTNMIYMFYGARALTLDLSNFDTSKVTDMGYMFDGTYATKINGLEKFNTSKVKNMRSMFDGCQVEELDLSSFDTSKVTDMSYMFQNAKATTGYARTQTDADKFNASSNKPSTLTFTVK